jgi:hypothetical protein
LSTRPLGESNTVIRLRTSLENLRSVLVDLEALAHAAWETLDRLPFLPTPLSPRSEGQELESRLNYGRLQALVTATASSAKEVLLVCSDMVESSYEFPVTSDDDEDEGSGSGGAGTPGSSRNGEPDASGPGNVPQAQAITDAEPMVWGSGNVPQARQELIELSFDDIVDGPSEPPGGPGGGVPRAVSVPRTWQSRGGIVLDVAAGPPELAPLVLADSARVTPQPPRWHELA